MRPVWEGLADGWAAFPLLNPHGRIFGPTGLSAHISDGLLGFTAAAELLEL